MQLNNNSVVAVRQQQLDETGLKNLISIERTRGHEVSCRFLKLVSNTPLYEIVIHKAKEAV